jgi:outer membrane protein, heavy metal efflux system
MSAEEYMQTPSFPCLTAVAAAAICFISSGADNPAVGFRDAVRLARTGNPFQLARRLDTDIAAADRITAGLFPNPQVSGQSIAIMDAVHRTDAGFLGGQNAQWLLQLSYPIPMGGKRGRALDLAGRNAEWAASRVADAAVQTAYDAGRKWLDVWFVNINRRLVEEAKANIDSLVAINEARARNEVITRVELARTQILQEQYDLQRRSLERDAANESRSLQILLGLSEARPIDMDDAFVPVPVPESIETLLEFAQARRSDKRAARSALASMHSALAYQRALAVPDVSVSAVWNPQNGVPYFGLGLGLELPLFSRNQGNIQKAEWSEEQARRVLRAVEQTIETDTRNAFETYHERRETNRRYAAIITQAGQVLDTIRYAYLRGQTTLIDFLEAQRTWFETKKQLYETQLSFRQSYWDLLLASGLIEEI